MHSFVSRSTSKTSALLTLLAAPYVGAFFEATVFAQEQQLVDESPAELPFDRVLSLWEETKTARSSGDAAAKELEKQLLTLLGQHPNDLRAVGVLRDLADRRLAAVERGEISDDLELRTADRCTNMIGCYAGSRAVVVQGMIAEASRNYAEGIALILRDGLYSSDELRHLEMGLVRGAEFIRDYYSLDPKVSTGTRTKTAVPVQMLPVPFNDKFLEPWLSQVEPIVALVDWELPYESAGTPQESYLRLRESRSERFTSPHYRGRQSLRRLFIYDVVASRSPLAQATSIVNIADWDLLFDRNRLAVEGYALALGMLERAGVGGDSIAELFAPTLPVVLPAFEANPLLGPMSASHIDVAFEITKFGRARAITILDAVNATDAVQADLIAMLKGRRFRPRLTGGGLADSPPVTVRYYVPVADTAE